MTRPTGVRLVLIVEAGPDAGLRLALDESPRIVGRGRDAALVLRDPSVSRQHLVVRADGDSVHVEICPGASTFVVGSNHLERARLSPGAFVSIGDTHFRVVAEAPSGIAAQEDAVEDVATLLSGTAVDVRGLAALFALVEALDGASDLAAVHDCVERWAREHADATHVEFASSRSGAAGPARTASAREVTIAKSDGGTSVTVPAHTRSEGWITFRDANGSQ